MKKVTRIICILTVIMLSLALCLGASACAPKTDYTVGVLQLIQHNALDAATRGFVDTLKARVAEAGKTIIILEQNASGDVGNCTSIAGTFKARKVDLVMANATPALMACATAMKDIPILGTSITEYGVALGIEGFSGTVGGNVSGTSDLAPLADQVQMMLDLVPSAQRFGVLYCSSEPNSRYQADEVSRILREKGKDCRVETISSDNDIPVVLTNLVQDIDVLYIPTDNTMAANAAAIDRICAGKTPVFCGEEGACVGCGFATLTIDYYQLGVVTGEMAAEILLAGGDISTMPIRYDNMPQKKFVDSRCQAFGIVIPENSGFAPIGE